MERLGEKLSEAELDAMISAADLNKDGKARSLSSCRRRLYATPPTHTRTSSSRLPQTPRATHTHTHTHYYTSQNSHRVIRVAFACRSTTRSSCACGSRSSVRRPHRPSRPASTSQRAHLLSSPPALLGERLRTLPSHYRFPIPSAWRMSRNVAKHRQQPQPPCR